MRLIILFFLFLFLNADVLIKSCSNDKKSALQNLILEISATISSNQSRVKKIENNTYTKKFVSKIDIKSSSYLQGIKFKKENNKFCAILTQKALNNTISSLKDDLNRDLSKLSLDELEQLKVKANFLKNLAYFANKKNLILFANEKLNKIDFYLNAGSVKFITNADEIIIDNKKYKPFEDIYLKGNRKYLVVLKKDGYTSEERSIYISVGDHRSITLNLVKKLSTLSAYIKLNDNKLKDFVESIISKSDIQISSNCEAHVLIEIDIKRKKEKIDEYIKNSIEAYVKVYQGKKLLFSLRGKIKPFFTDDNIDREVYYKKVKKLLSILLRKAINKIANENLLNRIYNYCKI